MITETYKGVRLRVRTLPGQDWGYTQMTVNGVPWFKALERDENKAMEQLKRNVDAAHERPEAYPDYWKPRTRKELLLEARQRAR